MHKRSDPLRPWWLLPIGRVAWWWWVPAALVVFAGDYLSGPDPAFPVIYCLAVFGAAWYSGAAVGIGLAAGTALVHAGLLALVWDQARLFTLSATLFRAVIVGLVALWIARFADHERELYRHVQTLEGLLPICAFCKSIRNDSGQWEKLEVYISDRSGAQFSHGFCPDCQKLHYPEVAGIR